MSFLSPLFLAGALAAAIPIVLHLLKREPEARVRFSAVRLLTHAPVEQASRRRLRELLLLALRVTALLLLALAFARPFFQSNGSGSGETTVIAIDVSMSMSAPGQFARARQLAVEALDRAPAGDLVGVVTFDDRAHVVVPPTFDRGLARGAIESASPGAGPTSYRAALATAGDLLKGGAGTITVVTDLQESGWDAGESAVVPAGAVVRVADVGAPPPNLAVTAIRVSGERVHAAITNQSAERAQARVALRVHEGDGRDDGTRVAAEKTAPVAPGQTITVEFARPTGLWAAVAVEDQVGPAADNLRYVMLDDTSRPSVLVVSATGDVSRDAFYLQQALAASGSDGRAYEVLGVAASDLGGAWAPERIGRQVAVVLASTRGLDHRGRQLLTTYLRSGGGLLVAGGPDVDGDVLDEVLGGPRVGLAARGSAEAGPGGPTTWAAADVRHPVVRAFGVQPGALGLVQFRRTAVLRPQDCQVLARLTTGDAALVDCGSGDGHAIVFASDLDNRGNDFPLRATFVPFVHQSMRYLSSGRTRMAEYLVGGQPGGVPGIPGIAPIGQGDASQLVAVNVDPAEIDGARLSSEDFAGAIARVSDAPVQGLSLQAREEEERQHVWQYVLAAMMVILAAESYVAAKAG